MPSVQLASWIEKNPGVRGGDACIRKTRHGVAGLVQWRRLGLTDDEILDRHPDLTQVDLETAWAYYDQNPEEVDRTIREDEDA
jgi:uncharacterized protein (DUF433 family)